VAVDPIEKKPLFHFYPGSQVYSLGGWGCNFHCVHCQNWQISCPVESEPWVNSREILPAAAIAQAKRHGCRGIAWTYNEPTVWFEYTSIAKLAKANNLYTVYVTTAMLPGGTGRHRSLPGRLARGREGVQRRGLSKVSENYALAEYSRVAARAKQSGTCTSRWSLTLSLQ